MICSNCDSKNKLNVSYVTFDYFDVTVDGVEKNRCANCSMDYYCFGNTNILNRFVACSLIAHSNVFSKRQTELFQTVLGVKEALEEGYTAELKEGRLWITVPSGGKAD